MAHPVAEIFTTAAEFNETADRRQDNALLFEPGDRLIVTGDIHGNRGNLSKIIIHANLKANPNRMLILQELIHGGPIDANGGCRSFEALVRAARIKNQFPEQVHFLLSNHDAAQMAGNEITKDGCGSCKIFTQGLINAYGDDADEIVAAMNAFFRSEPLLARCPNGVVISHSLPSPGREQFFDPKMIDRPYEDLDFGKGQSVYEMIWGRRQTPASLDIMADILGATAFINAHQPQASGYRITGRQLILASEHPRGVIAEFQADEEIDLELLDTLTVRIATL